MICGDITSDSDIESDKDIKSDSDIKNYRDIKSDKTADYFEPMMQFTIIQDLECP